MFESPVASVICWTLALITVFGAVNWLFYAQNNDLVAKLSKKPNVRKGVYVAIGICGLLFVVCKMLFHTQHGASLATFSFY